MPIGGMVDCVASAAPCPALQAYELPQQLLICWQFHLPGIQPRQEFQIQAGTVQFGRGVCNAVLGKLITRPVEWPAYRSPVAGQQAGSVAHHRPRLPAIAGNHHRCCHFARCQLGAMVFEGCRIDGRQRRYVALAATPAHGQPKLVKGALPIPRLSNRLAKPNPREHLHRRNRHLLPLISES